LSSPNILSFSIRRELRRRIHLRGARRKYSSYSIGDHSAEPDVSIHGTNKI